MNPSEAIGKIGGNNALSIETANDICKSLGIPNMPLDYAMIWNSKEEAQKKYNFYPFKESGSAIDALELGYYICGKLGMNARADCPYIGHERQADYIREELMKYFIKQE